MKKEVAQVLHARGCFSLRPQRPPTLDVLTAASAASTVLQDESNPAVLWLDAESEAVFLTERWQGDVVTQRLPVALDVQRMAEPFHASAEEHVVATVAFNDRRSLEYCMKLGLHVLPDWLSIRRGGLGRNLLMAHGHWLLGYHGQAVRLMSPTADLVGLLRLNLSRPGIELCIAQGQGPVRVDAVTSLQLAGKALKHHAHGRQLSREVQQSIQDMQPCLKSLHKLRSRLDASAQHVQAAASMRSWLNGGIIAALVDCAATTPTLSSLQKQGFNPRQLGQGPCSPSTAAADVLRSISGCLSLVLAHAEQQAEQQARLLLDCITRCLWGRAAQALNAAQLLGSVLHELTNDNSLWQPLQQACQDMVLLQHLLQRYTSVVPVQRNALGGTATLCGPWSHPVALPCNNEPGEDTYADACLEATSARAAAISSDGASGAARRPVVPRLSLPTSMPGSPHVHLTRSSRLPCRPSDAARDAGGAAETQPGSATSFIAALQQLGHSCGESVMAADLAAFVTHKQLHASNAEVAWEHRKQGAASQSGCTPAQMQPSGRQELLLQEQLCTLPCSMQLQLQLLQCMHVVVQQLPQGLPLPRCLGYALLEQLLLPCPLLQQEMVQLQQSGQLLGLWTQQRQQLSMQLLARCSQPHSCQHQPAVGSMPNPPGGTLLPQFRQRLLDICSSRKPGGSGSSVFRECRDVLLLLHDYLISAARPHEAEAACSELGRALCQVEHLLRANRLPLWGWPAVQAMDALVQVYVQLAKQVATPLAAGYLLQLLGSQQANSSTALGAAIGSVDGCASALAPADTLQLVLDFLLQRLPAGHTSARSSPDEEQRHGSAAGGWSHAGAGASVHGASSSTPAASGSSRSNAAGAAEGEATEVNGIRAHCWQLLTAVLQLEAVWHANRPVADSTFAPGSLAWSSTGSSSGGASSVRQKQHRAAALAGGAHGSPLCSSTNSSTWGAESSRWDDHSAGGTRVSSTSCADALTRQGQHMYAQLTPSDVLDVQCAPGSTSAGGCKSALGLAPSSSSFHLDAVGLLASSKRTSEVGAAGGEGGAAGSEALQLLVDLLLRQRGGRRYAVAHLDELDGSQAALPLQLEVLNFIESAFGVPNSYPLSVPQLAEFHVHYHLLHFTRHYYKLPNAPGQAVAACSKGHIKVLLALCLHTGSANLIRRRFTQLRVLDFLMRELGLEHALLARQQRGQGSSSGATTPASTARSSVTSTVCALTAPGEGWTAAAQAGGALQEEAGTHGAEGVLTERGITGLLSSSVSSLSVAREAEQEQQSASETHAPVAEDGTAAAAAVGATHCEELGSALPSGQIAPQQQQQHVPASAANGPAAAGLGTAEDVHSSQQLQATEAAACSPQFSASGGADGSNAGSKVQLPVLAIAGMPKGSPARLGSVQSRVQKYEAAAAAAQAEAAGSAKPPQQPQPGGCVVAPESGVDAAAAGRGGAFRTPRPPSKPGPSLAMGLRSRSAVSCLALEGCALSSSGDGSDGKADSSPVLGGARAGVGAAAFGSQPGGTDDREAINAPDSDCGVSEDVGSDSDSLPLGPASPPRPTVDWKRLDSSSNELDTSMRLCSGAIGPPTVPRLAFGMPAVPAPAAAAAITAADADSDEDDGAASRSYRPGFDLEEDFERMINEEEAGMQGGWDLSSEYEGSGSECSSLIAAGHDVFAEPEQQASPARSKLLLPPLRSAAQPSGSGTVPDCCNELAGLGSSHALDGAEFPSHTQLCGVNHSSSPVPAGLPVHAETATVAQADAHNPEAAAGAGTADGGGLIGEACLEDAVGLHEEEDYGQEQAVQEAYGGGSASMLSRRSLVPYLNLPANQSSLLDSPTSSTASAPQHASVPSLLAAATPLVTSRPPAQPATGSQAASGTRRAPQAPATPRAAAGLGSGTLRTGYHMHRRKHAMYADAELHVLCLELALHLLSSPSGMLDPLQLPQDPTDNALHRKVLVLVAHLSEPENAHVAQALAERASSQLQHPLVAAHPAEDTRGAAAAVALGLAACTLRLLKLLSPAMFGASRLQLSGMIQQGAFSEVQAGTLLHDGKPVPVAVKLVAPAENDASCFERIYNEVAILEKVRGHAGIVPLLDYGVTCGGWSGFSALPHQQPQWALVFPRYSGSLRAWRQHRGRALQLQDVALYLRVFLRVASTVSALHASNIVHYDIKGDNLLLDTGARSSDDGSSSSTLPFNVVLADFGDALVFDAGGSAFAQRHRGTELFSSPEMLLLHAGQQNPGHEQHDRRKHRGVGRAHDVWSLGCTLYELLTGRVLFEQEGVGRITAYAPISTAGGTAGPGAVAHSSRATTGSVLGSRERAALAQHAGLIDLVEFMLVGNADWRPGAPEVVCKTQLLLASVEASMV